MHITFTGRNNLEITPAMKSHTEEKVQRLLRRNEALSRLDFVFHVEHLQHIVEATAHLPGTTLHATAEASDMYSAIDAIIDKLITQIIKHKERHH